MRIKRAFMYTFLFLTIFSAIVRITADAAPSVSARSAILIEKDSGRVIFAGNCDEQLPMASTTKIITAAVALDKCGENLDEVVEITAAAAGVEGSSMYLQAGERLTIRELLYGLMLSSGNDAAVAIAEKISGNQEDFANLMNEKAKSVGATHSNFTNPNGLPDDNHYSTARDMAVIAAHAMSNPVFAELAASKAYKIEGEGKAYPRALSNHNRLLKMYDGCIGIKTGFTKAAGRCLVSAAQRNGMTLICVTLNAPDDWNDHMQLFDYGFNTVRYEKLAGADSPVCAAEVNGSADGVIPIYPERDVYYPLLDGEEISSELEIYPELSAPIAQGEQVGRLHFSKNGEEAVVVPLVINSEVDIATPAKHFGKFFAERLSAIFEEWAGFVIGAHN